MLPWPDAEARHVVAAAREQQEEKQSLEWLAGNMVSWFSQRITVGESDWVRAFERTRIDGLWVYKPVTQRNGSLMPTVLRSGPYRFYLYSHEPNELPHVHVDRDDLSAKFWLQPVELARNFGFSPKELRRIQKLVIQHQTEFLEAWHGHLGAGG